MNKIMGISMAGLSLSVAVGVPLGSFLSQLSNWHSAFWASAVLTVFSLILIIAIIPNTTAQNQKN
ncbi:sugar efflux transporter [Lactococcus lactis]|nr:sugar efflux transporter [Lactococcus lactis]